METTSEPTFGALLKGYRTAMGLTQEELAERADLSVRSLNYLEKGARRPYRATADALAAALGLTPEQQAAFERAAQRARVAHVSSFTGWALRAGNLPAPNMPLIGRGREMAAFSGLLRHGPARLLTLVGPPGVGKTHLALHLAAALQPAFAHGIAVVVLALLADPALVLPTIARTFGLRETAHQPLQQSLHTFLHDKELLLLLDNCEHLLPAAPPLAELVGACPHLRVLATSRAPLHVRHEQVYPLEPLALPDPAQPPSPATLRGVAAVELFTQRAQAVRPDFAVTEANAAAVAALCVRLDGLPLALELAAVRTRFLPPAALLARLQASAGASLRLLAGGAADLPPRQRTLRDTVAWSHGLLEEREQRIYRRLGVFVGGCTLEAAEAVCGGEELEPEAVLEALELLASHSLLRMEEPDTGEARVGLLELLREYALERLRESGEEEMIRARHALHYHSLAEEAETHLIGPAQALWLERLERELENLRASLRWAAEANRDAPERLERDPMQVGDALEVGLRLASALRQFWILHTRYSEGRDWLDTLLKLAPQAVPATVRAKALAAAGTLAFLQSDLEPARLLCEQSLALARVIGDPRGIARSLHDLGNVADREGDFASATALYEESLAALHELPELETDTYLLAMTLKNLGNMARHQARYDRASDLYAESLTLFRRLGADDAIATAIFNQGMIAWYRRDYARAEALLGECLELRRALGDSWGIADALLYLARVALEQGDLDRAEALLGESLGVPRAAEDRRYIGAIHSTQGDVALWRGNLDRATTLYHEAAALAPTVGDRWLQAEGLRGLGMVANRREAYDDAATLLDESIKLYRALGLPVWLLFCLEEMARAVAGQGHAVVAVRLLGAIAVLRQALGTRLPPILQPEHQLTVLSVRNALGGDAFDTAWSGGQALSLEDAIAEVHAALMSSPPETSTSSCG